MSCASPSSQWGRLRQEVPIMRKRVPFLLLLTLALSGRAASADPLQITSGSFLLDIEGDIYTLTGSNFKLVTTTFGIYAPKEFPGRCGGSTSPFEFCDQREGQLVDWSFHTTGGEQLLSRGSAL